MGVQWKFRTREFSRSSVEVQDERVQWDCRYERRKKQTGRKADGGNIDWYHDGNPIYRVMCIIWFGIRITPDCNAFGDEGRTALQADSFLQHMKETLVNT